MPRRSSRARARGKTRGRPPATRRRDTPGRDRGPAPFRLPWGVALALLGLGAVLLHHDALRLPFFADDYLFLEQVRGRSLPAALAAPDAIGNFFRPAGRQLYFWLLGRLSGESPLAFHAANLVLFLSIVSLLFAIVRRLAGPVAAVVAGGFVALHYAADVPLRWVSGSQDLLAVAGALGAIALHLAGRRLWAAPVLLVGLLAKETVLLTPLIAVALDRRPDERWRAAAIRAWPLALASVVWAALWLLTARQRTGLEASLGLEPLGAVAVLAHLVHVAVGLEWRGSLQAMGRVMPPWLALLPVLVAVLGARSTGGPAAAGGRPPAPGRILRLAGAWAVAAVVPLVAVASVWSAYYYLFALCGVALAIGAFAARGPRWVPVAVVIALAAGSQSGRESPEFATGRGAWVWQSHINRLYVDRATGRIARYLDDLKRQRPTVPPQSTFFFAGVPAFLSWQAADGPLVRWAYRDTSLRSYFQTGFTLERARRGPAFFFAVIGDTLREEGREPARLQALALRILLNDGYAPARDLLAWTSQQGPPDPGLSYFRAWLEWALGDSLTAKGLLASAGVAPRREPAPERSQGEARFAAGDTLGAVALLVRAVARGGLDPVAHAMLADVRLRLEPADPRARIEALAARVLDPGEAIGWLRWGAIQAHDGRHTQAIRSFERGLALGIADSTRAVRVRQIVAELRRLAPGGDLVQEGLLREGALR